MDDTYPIDQIEDAREAATVSDHDLLPYISMPIVYSQPVRLAAMAALHGLNAPDPESAAVIELGCASGGNIIPLAARFPKATFVGLDLSRRHVEDGCRRIAALGLRNIEIVQADIGTYRFPSEPFDYLLCHGVFSWVPQTVQDAILVTCRDHLTSTGMAVISYNVLPGWHLRMVIRDICRMHAGSEGGPLERVKRARAALEMVAVNADTADPYGHTVRAQAARLAKQPSSYILGEFLAEVNAPCTFPDLVSRARMHGLSYLCEADLPSTVPEYIAPRAATQIRALAAGDPIALQQHTDIFSGRTFRRSLFMKAAHASAARQPAASRMQNLSVASALKSGTGRSDQQAGWFADHRGKTLEVRHPSVRRTLSTLAERFPCTATISELVEAVPAADAARVRKAVFGLVASGRAILTSNPLKCAASGVLQPRVWALARTEAGSGQPWVTSLRHTAVMLNPLLRLLIAAMDGTNDIRALTARLVDAHCSGKFSLTSEITESQEHDIETTAARAVSTSIDYLAFHALLEPA
jgi:methyltransferase-like protein/protein-L-isoaspartate O-methyltransferase